MGRRQESSLASLSSSFRNIKHICMHTIFFLILPFFLVLFLFLQIFYGSLAFGTQCIVDQKKRKKKKHLYLFQYNLSHRNETGTYYHGLLSTSIWCTKIFLRSPSTWRVFHVDFNFLNVNPQILTNFNFFNVNPQIWQWDRKIHCSNLLDTNFHNISDIILRVIRRRIYS